MAIAEIEACSGGGGSGESYEITFMKFTVIDSRTKTISLTEPAHTVISYTSFSATINTVYDVSLPCIIHKGENVTFTDGNNVSNTISLSADGLTVSITRASTYGSIAVAVFG